MSSDNYDTPKTPPATPPTIDPEVKPKTAAEFADEGDKEGDVLGNRSDPDQIDTELSEKLRQRNNRDGEGEQSLNRLPPN